MFTRAFCRDLAERVVATFAEALAALLLADGTGLLDAHWTTTVSVAGMTALVTFLKGVAAGKLDAETGASLLSTPPPRVEGRRRSDRGGVDGNLVATIVVAGFLVYLLITLFELLAGR